MGGDVIADAIAFFAAFEGMDEGFKERARRVEAVLSAQETSFVLVTSPRPDAVNEAKFFAQKLGENDIDVEALIVNRVHPNPGEGNPEADRQRAHTLEGSALADHYRCLADLREIAHEERRHLAAIDSEIEGATVSRVPYLPFEVSDLDTLAAFADHLFERQATSVFGE